MNVLAYVHLRNIHRCTGAGRVARELIEHLALRQDVNMHILADQGDYNEVAHKVGGPWTTFPYHLFSSDTSFQQAKWIFLQRPAAEVYWPKAEIVHCTMESYVPKAGARLVVTIHDAAYFDGVYPHCFATFKQQLKWRVLYSRLSRTVDVFHTVSHFSAERLAEAFPMIRSRLRVIHNAVSPLFFEPFDADAEAFLEISNLKGKRFVLLPGGLHHRKNAELVLKAWPILKEKIPDLTLVVAGHNHPDYLRAAKGLGSSVLLTGFVEDQQLRALYQGAQAVWFPSQYEGFGIPVLESMACGTPVVASNNTAIPEISGDAAILVDPRRVDQNVEALESVVNDSQLREKLRKKGRKRAETFTWTASAAQLHSVYSELM
jgi:glycosyltransferase involved in cell wall biosynthesis